MTKGKSQFNLEKPTAKIAPQKDDVMWDQWVWDDFCDLRLIFQVGWSLTSDTLNKFPRKLSRSAVYRGPHALGT